ncbi:MAG: hypothetical protein IPL71_09605 [Anaerolineales bacterium]|uniref:hypothetical protein n=1 Tax=Candidatus Villigracilis proximus TaxID=3140683 RepID=UPI003135366A|nr:hypothetical protein [Anaerolineales bacterium]
MFGEAQKILQERRERRASKNINVQDSNKDSHQASNNRSSESIGSINEAMSTQISENILKNEISELEHLLKLKDTYSKRYQLAKEKISIYGTLDTPYKVLHELEEAEEGIEDVVTKLKSTLAKIYNKEIVVNN